MKLGFLTRAFSVIARNHNLIFALTRRDIAQRFRSSALGPVWLIGQPLLLLMLYSFVFQVVLRARWGVTGPSGSEIPFSLILFVGLVLHTIVADTIVRAPATITSNVSFVKRVVFPIEILPVVNVMSSLVTAVLSLLILIVAMRVFAGFVHWQALACIIPIFGLILFTIGLGWLLAALGVYLRDLNQIAPLVSTLLMFTAPIVYPIEMVPQQFHLLMLINPLTIPVEWCRQILFEGTIAFRGGGIFLLISLATYVLGFGFFRVLRREFADVL